MNTKKPILLALLLAATTTVVPALAQQITGTPGSPSATTTIPGNQLPAPAPKFGGVIKDDALHHRDDPSLPKPKAIKTSILNAGRLTLAMAVCSASALEEGKLPVATAFTPSIANKTTPTSPAPEGMVWIPGGEFSMGSEGKCDGKSCCSPATVADALPSIAFMSMASGWTRRTSPMPSLKNSLRPRAMSRSQSAHRPRKSFLPRRRKTSSLARWDESYQPGYDEMVSRSIFPS